MNKKILFEIIFIIFLILSLIGFVYYRINNLKKTNDNENVSKVQNGPSGEMKGDNKSSSDIETVGVTEVTGDLEYSSGEYKSENSDESVFVVTDGGNLNLTDVTISKTGDTSNTENSEFYGVNSGILAKTDGTINMKNVNITTDSKGSNAVFATGENAKIYISDSTINTSSNSSRGLDATYGGYIEADNVTITTKGTSCATLATDRGEGTVIAKNSTLTTAGAGSPVIYSTGNITLEKSIGLATGAQITVVEGKNSATIKDSTVTCSGKGNRNDVDNCGVMIYQSMSGDAGEGTGTFSASGSKLSIGENSDYYKTAPFFFVTNTQAVINLENCTLNFGSNLLLSSKGTSEWGKSGSNGGDVTFNAINQILSGNIELDELSSLELNLKSGSSYEGAINTDNTAKSVKLSISSDSKVKLTGDCYVTELNDDDSSYSNIDFNGYKLYVNGTAIN